MDEKNYNSDQEKDWNSDYNQKREDESDDFGLPDVSYDPHKKDREQSYDYGQSSSDPSSDANMSGDYNSNSDYGQSSDYGSSSNYDSGNDYNNSYESSFDNENKEENQYNDNYEDSYQDEYREDTYEDEYNYDDDYYDDDDDGTDNTGKVLLIILAILIIAGGLFAGYWFWLKDVLYPEGEVTDTEVFDETAGDTGMEEETGAIPDEAFDADATDTGADATDDTETTASETTTSPANNTPGYSPGSATGGGRANISTIQSRTGNYWIVVGSFIDDDMAIDYGKKLASAGTGSFLIYPYGNTEYYRLAIDKAGSWGAAENILSNYRSQYGSEVWILKY